MMEEIDVVRIVAKREGFRRAGYVFGSTPIDIPLSALSERQRAALDGEPMLICQVVSVEDHDDKMSPLAPAAAADSVKKSAARGAGKDTGE